MAYISPESRGGTCFVSPHSDDLPALAAFMLVYLGCVPKPFHLACVFTNTRHCHASFRPPRGSDVTRVREAEDMRFCSEFDLLYHGLGFNDYPLRVGRSEDRPSHVLLASRVMRRLYKLLKLLQPSYVCVPLPYGSNKHVDHQIACQAVIGAATAFEDLVIMFTDDIPYSRRRLTEVFTHSGMLYTPRLVPLSPEDERRKLKALSHYRSQYPARYHGAITRPAPGDPSGGPSETFWLPEGCQLPGLEASTRSLVQSEHR